MKDKFISSAPHGRSFRLNPLQQDLLASPYVQRLKDIKQLSLAYLVYPDARHSRLSHSSGVSHIAGEMGEHLNLIEPFQYLLRAAGELHDVGHTAFSHTLESSLEKKVGDHMEWTARLIRGEAELKRYGKNEIPEILRSYGLNPDDVANLVNKKYLNPRFPFLQDIIFGSVDCDLLDYLIRDSYFTNPKLGVVDLDRIKNNLVIKDNKLCILNKGKGAIDSVFQLRNNMYNRVYLHHAVRIADNMLRRGVSLCVDEVPDFYEFVDDELMERLRSIKNPEAKYLIDRVRNRDLFKRAYVMYDYELAKKKNFEKFKKLDQIGSEKIEKHVSSKIKGLKKEHVIVDFPINSVLLSEPRLKNYKFNILQDNGEVSEISKLRPKTVEAYAKELSLPENPFILAVPEEYRSKASSVMNNLISKL